MEKAVNIAVGGSSRALGFVGRYIDYKLAGLAAVGLATVVWIINSPHGIPGATTAALKQGTYTFLVSGFIARTCERLATSIRSRGWALLLACAIPSMMAVFLTFMVHNFKGTPEPVLSTLPTALTAPPANLWWARRKRRQRFKVVDGRVV